MSTNFPGALDDSTTLPDPGSGSFTNNPSHLGLHGNENAAIKAIEAKLGTGASTPPGGGFIFTSSSNGTSSWQAAPAAGVWGLITGTLSNQTDLQTALNAKLALGGGTMTGLLVLSADPSALLGAATKQYVDALGSTSLVRNETPGGSVNSSNVNFTTAATYATGSLKVYLNGQRLAPGSGIDYVEVTQGFTMQYAPLTGDVLLVDYETTNTTRFVQGSNSYIVQETPTGTVNGATVLFTVLQAKYVANTLEVYLNGVQQTKTTDYTETSPGSGTFTFVAAPVTGDIVRVGYQFATGASGNADTVDGIHGSDTGDATGNLIADYGGWKKLAMTLTYASATTFTVSGDQTLLFSRGTKLWLNQSGSKYFYVISSSFSVATTTVTISGGTDYTLANAAITAPYYSYEVTPQGFPGYFNFTPSITNLTTTGGTMLAVFTITGRRFQATVSFQFAAGSSIGGTLTVNLPFTAAGIYNSASVLGMANWFNTGSASFLGQIYWGTSTTAFPNVSNTAGTFSTDAAVNATVPFTWSTTSRLSFNLDYLLA